MNLGQQEIKERGSITPHQVDKALEPLQLDLSLTIQNQVGKHDTSYEYGKSEYVYRSRLVKGDTKEHSRNDTLEWV